MAHEPILESEYLQALMDDFEMTPEDTIGELIEALKVDEAAEAAGIGED